jgi:hypothetical protein
MIKGALTLKHPEYYLFFTTHFERLMAMPALNAAPTSANRGGRRDI